MLELTGIETVGALAALRPVVPALEQRLRELTERRDALVVQREQLLEQIRDANETIGWLRAELRVLTPRRGFFAWLLS